LAKAGRLYRVAVQSTAPSVRRRSFDQLLMLESDRGQFDEVVRFGEDYRSWLTTIGDGSRAREVSVQVGLGYYSLGHYRRAERELVDALGDGNNPLDPALQLGGLTELAHLAERYHNKAGATDRWRRVEKLALRQIETVGRANEVRLIEFTRRLADSYRFQERYPDALKRLEALLPIHEERKDPADKSTTVALIAAIQSLQGKPDEADKSLREAIRLRAEPGASDSLAEAELWADLADTQTARDLDEAARTSRVKAMGLFQKVLQEPAQGRRQVYRHSQAFWRLQQLHQQTRDYNKALALVDSEAAAARDLTIPDTRLKTEMGYLNVFLGTFPEARRDLRDAVAGLEKQYPINLIDLPRALNSLAVVEQSTDGLDRAEELAQRVLRLYKENGLPDDPVLVEAYNLLGTNRTLKGEHAEAAEYFQEGIDRCAPLGRKGDRLLASLSVNLALLHKSQGDLEEALKQLEKAGEVFRRFTAKDSPELLFYDAALAALNAERSNYDVAADLAETVLERCERLKVTSGPLVTMSMHCRALRHLVKGRYQQADADWNNVLKLQEAAKQEGLMPRTLNYLAVSAERQDKRGAAREFYVRALEIERRNKLTVPTTSFVTLWRLAALLDQDGKREEAHTYLVQAVDLVEAARLRTFGDAQQRTGFFAQFAPAFDELVRVGIRDGRIDEAFEYAARGRSRSLLDQLQLSGVDPRQELTGARGKALAAREAELLQKISGLRSHLQLIPATEADQEKGKALLLEIGAAQEEYAATWREILNASPTYRNLASTDVSRDLVRNLKRVLGPHELLLCYYLGRSQSYLFLVGPGDQPVEALALTIPSGLLDTLPRTAHEYLSEGSSERRGIGVRPKPPESSGNAVDGNKMIALTQSRARRLIDSYRVLLESSDFGTKRGIGIRPKDPAGPKSEIDVSALTAALLPPAVKQRIDRDKVDTLVVIPDGPLHKLPLEALTMQTKPTPRYVLDDYPPMVYAPSAAAFLMLGNRPAPAPGDDSLLTVCNPAYPQSKETSGKVKRGGGLVVGFQGQLIPLPGTSEESKRIRRLFPEKTTVALEGNEATEGRTRAEIGKHPYIHIAAHGFADDGFGNLFGALALTPLAQPQSAEDDGFLSLHEIYRLPLQNCRLVVLSACETNVGPQAPLEAGVTLASAFLSAGAQSVVASHWSVDDESTAELTSSFFRELRGAPQGLRAEAKALYKARMKVRSNERWAAPFYWAPFVVIGGADRPNKADPK
jgi:CHAT domain-containing protein/tetratricopeptide (TPR) repeat protein